jgi:hypothetical protein
VTALYLVSGISTIFFIIALQKGKLLVMMIFNEIHDPFFFIFSSFREKTWLRSLRASEKTFSKRAGKEPIFLFDDTHRPIGFPFFLFLQKRQNKKTGFIYNLQ